MSHLVNWPFRRPSPEDLAKEAERAIADGSIRRYAWARDEARRQLLRVLCISAAQREAHGLPHAPLPSLPQQPPLLPLDPLPYYEDELSDDSSPEPLWEAEHGPDTASSPYRSPAPMPPKREKPIAPTPSRFRPVMLVVMIDVVSFALGLIVWQLFVWRVGR